MTEGTKALDLPIGSDRTAYAHSFGLMPDRTVYFKPPQYVAPGEEVKSFNIDLRPDLKSLADKGMDMQREQLKALSISGMGAGTAGSSLIPVFVDPRIVDQTRKFTPWVELIARVSNQGNLADFNKITAKGGAQTDFEDSSRDEANDTEERDSTAIKWLYSTGRVTGPTQAAMPSYIVQGLQPSGTGTDTATFGSPTAPNAKQYEVLKKSRAIRELEENLIWNGNATTSAISGNPDTTEYDGIVTQQSTTNQTDKSSADLTWDDIEDTVKLAYDDSGRPTLAGSDSSSLSDIRKIMIDSFRFSPKDMVGTAGFGVPARVVVETMVGPIPIIPSQFLTNTTGAKQVFFLDMEFIEMRVLQDMTFEDLAKTNDSSKFMLKIYEALLLKATLFNSFIDNIA